ncbi:MAG TPA: hypothetical protein DEO70_02945 [Bacteroidales bacterium]|nr:MAG: hypothetical protein A2X11_09515 [Bacteroidetes bacterium GWE2_42_24]OFY25756.1 MAG: hypothetical protein A2X09_09240 [Bacteroidetes bacterium GWF2_43_11]PKP24073.1 MAG: hypothetical protein CVU06_05380 [Bacteroidetes bacterium HGW-Bacteroidetes-22]HBZ65767.1 hypothetical protein [Bacteroidales bacterium]
MTIRTFWTIFIKILGISLVLSSLTVFPQFLAALPFFGSNYGDNVFGVGLIFGLLLLTIALYIFVLWLFVFKTAWLIDKLHLDKGFTDNRIELNIQQSTVLTVAVIVVGGLIFVDSFPQLCRQTFIFFQVNDLLKEDPNSGWIIFQLVKTIIGYLLMTNSQLVIKFIDRETKREKLTDKNNGL